MGQLDRAAVTRGASPYDCGEDGEGAVGGSGVDSDARVLGDVRHAAFVPGYRDLPGPRVVRDAVTRHVPEWSRRPVTRYRAKDDPGVDCLQPFYAQPAPGQRSRAHRLYHDVGTFYQIQVYIDGFGLSQVQHDGPLAPVDMQRQ